MREFAWQRLPIYAIDGMDPSMATKNKTTTINVSLPVSQRKFVEADVARGGFASVSEYFRELIRERQSLRGGPRSASPAGDRERALEAVRTILGLQQKLALKGMTVEDLIGEGRSS